MKASQNIQRGRIKKTKDQIKKHVSQMTQEEIMYLQKRVKMISGNYKWGKHFLENGRLFNMLTIERLLNSPNIDECLIEYNERDKDKRVLLRSTFSSNVSLEKNGVMYMADANLCIVVDIFTGEVVTAYWNEVGDNHDNVNMRRYNAELKICA
jgi:hypothetical protein